ncbi:MAG: zf-HC2 domain-containing protein [Actinobacteria bacterium]|nr:zf-HC2 domain-containing protein [Actinomycetota bacterium]
MTPEHQQQREALGAYVVGALDPAERRHLEQHLHGCRDCTDELARLSALPGMLGRVSEQEVQAGLLVPSQDLLDGVIRRLADQERILGTRLRRWRLTAVAACLAALVAVVVAVAPWESEPDRVIVAADPASTVSTAATGQVAATAWEWGTTVELQAADLPRRDAYVLWAVADDGRREQAGTWGVTSSGNARVRGASSIDRSELARVDVTDRDGDVLMRFEFSPDSDV